MNMRYFFLIAAVFLLGAFPLYAAEDVPAPPEQDWHFEGITGTPDMAALQRGLKVYREVCSACHGLKRVHYRNLEELGYNENQVKNIAAQYMLTDGPNDEGEMFERAGRPSDAFVSPYPNDQAAKAVNNGALPPDLSLIVKARPYGADYLYALLTGYEEGEAHPVDAEGHSSDDPAHDHGNHAIPEENAENEGESETDMEEPAQPKIIHGVQVPDGKYYNKYFPGHIIAMAPPLSDGMVAYEDGTPETAAQYAKDVTNFLAWAADPYMPERKRTGIKVIIFLLVFAGVMYALKRKIWRDVH